MKIGTLCFATDSGLGILAKAFYDNGIVTHPYVVRHGRHPDHLDWYPDAPVCSNLRAYEDIRSIRDFCAGMDAMLFFETPFIWELIPHCKEQGVKTVIMPMYECMPKVLPAVPDLMLCPSLLDLRYYPNCWSRDALYGRTPWSVYLPVPVKAKWRLRERAEVFVHNAGHGGLKGRNGTAELIQALQYVKSSAKFIIRCQGQLDRIYRGPKDDKVRWEVGTTLPHNQLYEEGDVFVFPEKHNGLSLPLQEADASGMLVMATNRFPNNRWLPNDPLIPTCGEVTQQLSSRMVEFQQALIDPKDIAKTIDSWYGADITDYSYSGRGWAERHSWEELRPQYRQVLEGLL